MFSVQCYIIHTTHTHTHTHTHNAHTQSVKNHHFLNRRKAVGRCKKCEKGFGSWKKGRDFIGVSCSWCGDSYCMMCFDDRLRKEPCHMGPLRNLIIPPSWIVRTPPDLVCVVLCVCVYNVCSIVYRLVAIRSIIIIMVNFNLPILIQTPHASPHLEVTSPKNSRRKTRRSRRKKVDERASKNFIVSKLTYK